MKAIKFFFGSKVVYRNLPFVYFLAALGMVYIANAHYAERNIRQMLIMQKEIEEARWDCMTAKAELKQKSLRSEVAETVEPLGLLAAPQPPRVITVHSSKKPRNE